MLELDHIPFKIEQYQIGRLCYDLNSSHGSAEKEERNLGEVAVSSWPAGCVEINQKVRKCHVVLGIH